jgi:hypothetical protein
MTDVPATPEAELYADSGMVTRLSEGLASTPFPDADAATRSDARSNGVMKLRISGLLPGSVYYVRALSRDPVDPLSIGYSALLPVNTAVSVVPYQQAADGTHPGFINDLLTMKSYIRPNDVRQMPGRGDLLLLETPGAPYPVSMFVGMGTAAPAGVIDLNNLFSQDKTSLALLGGEKTVLTVYRGGPLATLQHYRRLPLPGNDGALAEPRLGFFADVNLDGRVDTADFEAFRSVFRMLPADAAYNPDFNFVADPDGRIDAQDFARFSREFGRTNVP